MVRFVVGLVIAGLAASAQAGPFEPGAARARVEQVLSRDLSRLDALYRDIHRHPELAFQEKDTAAKLAREMKAAGFAVTQGVGGTGVVAILKNWPDGPGPHRAGCPADGRANRSSLCEQRRCHMARPRNARRA